ncbi:hypothetical protein JTB14_016510 [Gonioctena quinquepunctata]|nr:hypothetical protein JTB14_016510 [Gonioctena quinquepunctata]
MSVRRSERKNRGIPPERYGEEKKNGDLPENGIETTLSSTSERLCNESINGITTVDVHVPMNSLKSYERRMKTGTTEVSSKMSRNTMRRSQLEIDLEAEKRIIELERRLILKEAQLKKVELEEEYGSRAEESSRNDNSNRKREDIQKWINEVKNSNDDITVLSFRSGKGADHEIASGSGTGTNIDYEKEGFVEKKSFREDEELSKFLARQSISKELPTFSGDPTEWLHFLRAFRETTEMCGFSDRENIARLQKCLKDLPNETRADISEVEVVHHHMKEEENKVLLRVAPVVINGPKDKYIQKLKEDNQIAIQQALDSEKEMNSLLEEQKKLVEEMDFKIKELKKEAADKGKEVVSVKTMDTQRDRKKGAEDSKYI